MVEDGSDFLLEASVVAPIPLSVFKVVEEAIFKEVFSPILWTVFEAPALITLSIRAVQKTIFSRNQHFQVILLITHKSKTIGNIAAAF